MNVLKAGLSRFMAQARAGAVIEVTSHDKPIARIVGIPDAPSAGVARLLAQGKVQWAGGKPKLAPAVQLSPQGKPLSAMVMEDRA
ncbi:MAG: type II toxin-antitoxin system Phd/YefM family antitoxin [Burkholderiales bacterium]